MATHRKDIVDHNLHDVVANAGGDLISLQFKRLAMPNGGCGSPTHVVGTNGGTLPCGSLLTRLDGTTVPYYCAHCEPEAAR